ncbi:MAG: ankyrin repeat domain-containing protein [Victivallaceae bacterium]|nr:ankyrin repeat domain-containing protein [Victivallaceae bacterium]
MRYLYLIAAATLFAGCAVPKEAELAHMRKAEARLAVCANDSGKLDSILDKVTLPPDKQQSLLVAAVNHDSDDCVEVMLKHGFDPDSTLGGRPLFIACRKNRVRMAEMLLDAGAGILDEYMADAVRNNRLDLAETLLKHGAPPRPDLVSGCSPEMLEMLLKYGLEPDARNSEGVSPLQFAINETSYPKAKMLLDAGAKASSIAIGGGLARIKNTAMILMLIRHGASPTTIRNDQYIFEMAVREGNLELLDVMLEHGFSVNIYNLEMLLNVAAESRDLLTVKKILEAGGYDLIRRMPDARPWMARISAIPYKEDPENIYIMAELVRHGVPFPTRTIIYMIDQALSYGDKEAAEQLCRAIADRQDTTKAIELSYSSSHDGTVAKTMLQAGYRPMKDSPMLANAIADGDRKLAEMLIARDSGINSIDSQYRTPLIRACEKADLEMVRKLLSAGADAKYMNARGGSPLRAAMDAYAKDVPGYVPNYPSHTGTKEARADLQEIIALLIDHGARVDKEYQQSFGIINAAMVEGNSDLLELLFTAGIDPATRCLGGETLLARSIINGHPRMFEYLLDRGTDPDVCFSRGTSLLQWLATCDDFSKMKLMLGHGANPDIRSTDGSTPVMLANTSTAIKMLLDAGADVNARDLKGQTALMTLNNKRTDVLETLIKAGVDLNAQNEDGTTALMIAAGENNGVTAKLLLDSGADPRLSDKSGKKALDYAASREMRIMLEHAMGVESAKNVPPPNNADSIAAEPLEAIHDKPNRVEQPAR